MSRPLLLAFPGLLLAQTDVDVGLSDPRVAEAVERLRKSRAATANFLVRTGPIVSPSREELERARVVPERIRGVGLYSVRVTGSSNDIGVIRGQSGRALIFVSTLDDLTTVAEHQRAVSPHLSTEIACWDRAPTRRSPPRRCWRRRRTSPRTPSPSTTVVVQASGMPGIVHVLLPALRLGRVLHNRLRGAQ